MSIKKRYVQGTRYKVQGTRYKVQGTRYKVLSFCLVFTIMITGCKNTILDQGKKPESVAKAYVENMFSFNNISNGRNADDFCIPEFFYEMKVVEEDGTEKTFADCTDAEKAMMVEAWKETQISEYAKVLENDTTLLQAIAIENSAFERAASKTKRCAEEEREEAFAKSYAEAYAKGIRKIEKQREADEETEPVESDGFVERWKASLNRKTLNTYVKNYKRGRVLYANSKYPGHASMMYLDKDKVDSNKVLSWDGMKMATITSYPKHGAWPGQVDGIQLEPIGYWCGSDSGLENAEDVKLLKVVGQYSWFDWVDGSFKVPGQWIGESTSVNDKAVSWADKRKTEVDEATGEIIKEGIPYVPGTKKDGKGNLNYVYEFIKYKDSDEYSYCSQVVWKGYKQSGTGYNFAITLPWISPWDIDFSLKTREVTTWSNY